MKLISQAGCAMLLASFLLLFGCGTVDTSVDDTPDEVPISDFLSMDFSGLIASLPLVMTLRLPFLLRYFFSIM